MKLTFLGAKYEFHPNQWQVEEGAVGGTYRGRPWKEHRLKEQHRSGNHVGLTYRGVPYTR